MTDKRDTKYRFNRLSDFKMPEETEKPRAAEAEAAFESEAANPSLTLILNQTKAEPDNQNQDQNVKAEAKDPRSDELDGIKSIGIHHKNAEALSMRAGVQGQSDGNDGKAEEDQPKPPVDQSQDDDSVPETKEPEKPKHMTINDLPKDEKPREKMLAYGADVLSNAELLAIIIGSGTKSINESLTAIELSQKILKHFGDDLTELYGASAEELFRDDELPGLGVAKACKIKAALELGHRAHRPKKPLLKISTSQDAADYLMPDMKNLKQEEFVVLLLDSKNHLFKKERVTKGTVNASLVTPREVFAFAVRQHATGIIVAHNHPSGDPTPSQADKSVTRELLKSGEIIGIPLLDHIIIGNHYFSFLEEGILC